MLAVLLMTFDAEFPPLGAAEEFIKRRPVRIVAGEAIDRLVVARIDNAGTHRMGQRRVGSVTSAAEF